MWTRRQFLSRSTLTILGLGGGAGLLEGARDPLPDGSASRGMITPAAQQAIDQGLTYLARSQHVDGSFGTGQYIGNVAITSLAALAMMAGGYQPGRGTYGKVVSRALDYVLNQRDEQTGFLHNQLDLSHGPMYGHGFGTLFLAEVSGLVQPKDRRKKVHDALKLAVDLIVNTQNDKGGWRYQPEKREADISVTICQIMALRAARNAGFTVPIKTVNDCVKYVKDCQDQATGGFRYMDVLANGAGFARTAAGVAALYAAGIYEGPEIESGLTYLKKNYLEKNQEFPQVDNYYFYGHYYAVQAMWTAGGTNWTEWFPAIREDLLSRTRLRSDGYWSDQICNHYGTAMACIILQVPNNYLPILQK